MTERYFHHPHAFPLESGGTLPELRLAYTDTGNPRGPVVWLCHALTANARPAEWWPGLVGPGRLFDPARYRLVCANVIGSCYGSTGPLSPDPRTGEPYYHNFPALTPRDAARALDLLRDHLQISRVALLAGASLGGQYALEWAAEQPDAFEALVLAATNAQHSPWGIAFNATQRMAIEADATWPERSPTAGRAGLKAARAVALLSYRSYQTYAATQAEPDADRMGDYRADSYQRYQGEKLARRFDAFSYVVLSRMMDAHHVGRGRGDVAAALAGVRARTLVVSIESDVLFPPAEQSLLAEAIPGAQYARIASPYGHDGFLIETEQLTQIIGDWWPLAARLVAKPNEKP